MGDIELVPPEERAFGPGGSVIMAPFTHLDPAGSRFADGTFGAFYAAAHLATSVAETCYHREIFLRATRQGPLELDMRSYLADVAARFHDIRGTRARMADVYDPDSYISSQVFGRQLKLNGSNGIVYDSVRHPGGECVAIYRPPHPQPAAGCAPAICMGWQQNQPRLRAAAARSLACFIHERHGV